MTPRACAVFLLLLALGAGMPARAGEGCAEEAFTDRIREAEAGRIVLESGRVLRLADIRLADETAALRRLGSLQGAEVAGSASAAADRWGRRRARLLLAQGGADLAGQLVGEGLAMVDPGEEDDLCRPSLLATEDEARAAGRGIWAREAPLAAKDPEAIAERAGRFAVIEGRIVSVGERARWTYLNFGRDFARDFAVSIPRRRWDRMKREGLSASALTGRRVRVRGIVEMRRAPGMEIATADVIERLGETASGGTAPAGARRRESR